MNTITVPASKARRDFTGLIRRLQSGHIDKVHITLNGIRVADIISLRVNTDPLSNTLYEMRKHYADKA